MIQKGLEVLLKVCGQNLGGSSLLPIIQYLRQSFITLFKAGRMEKSTKGFYFISKGLQHFLQAWGREELQMGSCNEH